MSEKPFWQQLRDKKLGKTVSDEKAKKEVKNDLAAWYLDRAKESPRNCENCNTSLTLTISLHPRGHIAHILAKGKHGCPSVATHPMNRAFLCKDCHAIFDGPQQKAKNMPIIPVLVKRVRLFFKLIPKSEVRRVPDFLNPEHASS